MKNMTRRFLAIFFSAMMACMCLGTTAFAAESETASDTTPEATCYSLEVTSNGVASITDEDGNEVDSISPRSSISGYNQATLTGDPVGVSVFVDSSGWGGMGVTVKASSSWSGYMNLDIIGSDGKVPLQGKSVYSNGETKVNNLYHYNPDYYVFSFRGIPSGQSVFVQIWVYG